MGCPSEVEIGDNLVFSVVTHDAADGSLTDADAVPAYRIYEDETDPPILTGNMAKLDDDDTLGFYTESIACTSGNGFENGKSYNIYITAAVDSVTGGITYTFKAYDERKSNVLKWLNQACVAVTVNGVPEVDITHLGGVAQSAADLKDFADAGYDPVTNKVQGVLLVDTTTTNSDMRGTDGANTAVPDVAGTAAGLHGTTDGLIGGLNDFDPANDTVVNVTNVNTTTSNSDMRGTDGANTAVPDIAGTAAGLHGTTDGLIGALNDFDPANDAVANVTAVGTTTTNSDMRGTNGANTTVPDVAGTAAGLHGTTDGLINGLNDPSANTIRDAIIDDATRYSGASIALIKAQTDDQPAGVKKNVALANFIFVMVDSTDNITPKTGLTVTTQISKDGAAFVNSTNSATEIGSGFYKISFTQAEMNYNTLGWKFSSVGANQRNVVVKTSV